MIEWIKGVTEQGNEFFQAFFCGIRGVWSIEGVDHGDVRLECIVSVELALTRDAVGKVSKGAGSVAKAVCVKQWTAALRYIDPSA